MSDINLQSQLAIRLKSLQQAGINWVSTAPELEIMHQPDLFAAEVNSNTAETEPNADTPVARSIELGILREKVKECTRCPELASTRTQTVFGVGPIDAEILFVGEAPGGDEDRQGIPFVGAAGQLLNRIIAACGLSRDEIFICNILRCRPPGNRQPKADECSNCREYLEKTIKLVRPKMIVAWGGVAAQNLLQVKTGITKLRGSFLQYNGIPVLCTFHPASMLEGRSPENKKLVWEDMKQMLHKLGKPIPSVKKETGN